MAKRYVVIGEWALRPIEVATLVLAIIGIVLGVYVVWMGWR